MVEAKIMGMVPRLLHKDKLHYFTKPHHQPPVGGGVQITNRLCIEETTIFQAIKEAEYFQIGDKNKYILWNN